MMKQKLCVAKFIVWNIEHLNFICWGECRLVPIIRAQFQKRKTQAFLWAFNEDQVH